MFNRIGRFPVAVVTQQWLYSNELTDGTRKHQCLNTNCNYKFITEAKDKL